MFGANLRNARKSKQLTLEELADRYNQIYDAGMNKGTLSKYENDKQEPMISVVNKLASILDVPIGQLLEDEQEYYHVGEMNLINYVNPEPEYEARKIVKRMIYDPNDNYEKERQALIQQFNQLNDDGKKRLLQTSEELNELKKFKK